MIEKKITLAVIVALIVELGGVFMWTGSAAERLSAVETRVSAQGNFAERLARVEAQQQLALEQLTRIERRLESR